MTRHTSQVQRNKMHLFTFMGNMQIEHIVFRHSQSVRKQLRCEKLENKIWIGTHLLSLGLQGTWQNNDGDMEEHWGDLHLTNWCLLACHVILMLEEDCHILAHSNAVIRQLALHSEAFIRWLTQEDDEATVMRILAGGKDISTSL